MPPGSRDSPTAASARMSAPCCSTARPASSIRCRRYAAPSTAISPSTSPAFESKIPRKSDAFEGEMEMASYMRRLVMAGAGLLTLVAASNANAQGDYPNKPVRIVVDSAPGSATDVVLRIVAERLSRIWNQQVIALNNPGAGG